MSGYPRAVMPMNRADLDALVAEATIDCDDETECVMGFYTMIGDQLATPFLTRVLGVDVTVSGIDLSGEQIVAVCTRGRWQQPIGILDLPLSTPPPDGAEWIEAYRHWVA
jgi:hypothetical protein